MMEIKSEDGQSYTIPLDSVDLTYLSKYVGSPLAEKRRLWTKKCLDGESEYCHVQVVTQDDNEDCNSEDTFDTVKCHICNVEVPVLCFERHNKSEKHVTLKTIFQKVLERVSKQINISVINNDEDLDKDVYFCVPCSKIIRLENQHKHESSEYHVNSRRSIDVVREFYKIFEQNKGHVLVKEEILDEKRDLSANKVCTEIIQNDTKNNNAIDATNEDKAKIDCLANDHTNTMKPNSTVEDLVRNEKHNKELTSEEKYFKDMIKKYNLKVNLPIVDGDFIQVASPSGIKVKISRDHFHSYQPKVEGNRVYCQMCTTWSELGEESKHKVTEKHVRNIFAPVNEKFARILNDYNIHCLICNKVTRLPSIHICQNIEDLANSIDTENIRQTNSENKINKCINNKEYISNLDLSENDFGNNLKGLVFCELCNVSLPQDQIEYHNAGTPHWSNAFKNICKNVSDGLQAYFSKDTFKTDSDLSGKQNDISKNDNVTKQNVISENDNVAKQNDVSENDNIAKQNDISENYNLAKQNDISENDNIAKQNDIPKNDYTASSSASNIANYAYKICPSRPFRFADSTKNNVTCIVCDIDIPNDARILTNHEGSSDHKLYLAKLLQFHRIVKKYNRRQTHTVVENYYSYRYFCECCNILIVMERSWSNIWAHIGTEQHTVLLRNFYENDSRILKLYVHESEQRSNLGIMYRELYKMLLQSNHICKISNSHFYCSLCEREFCEVGNEIDHMFSATHKISLERFGKLR